MSTKLSVRLSRLLNMVPYFQANPGISAAEAAAELGVTTKQLMNDLNQLWMCGLPGYGPGDLIDLSFSEDSIEVTYSAGMDRPVRLTSTEATALIVALHSLIELPGTVDPTAANSALAKIEAAAGAAAGGVAGRFGDRAPAPESRAAAVVRAATARGHAVRMVYYSASRDAVTERVVDPIRIVLVDRASYLEAWSREAEGVRLFRFDRIDSAVELDEPARPPLRAREAVAGQDLFGDDTALPAARLRIAPDMVWVLDQFPMSVVSADPDGSIEATMRYATLDWMVRLLLGFGSGVHALGPEQLVDAVRRRSTAALAAYDELDTAAQRGGVEA
jgi:proteasome accessory factor C